METDLNLDAGNLDPLSHESRPRACAKVHRKNGEFDSEDSLPLPAVSRIAKLSIFHFQLDSGCSVVVCSGVNSAEGILGNDENDGTK